MVKNNFKEISKKALWLHKKTQGKFSIKSKVSVRGSGDLQLVYTPGVGAVSLFLAQHPKEVRNYTMKRNSVAVVSDGSAVLGLGNIGPEAALPVMEGKCILFKKFADIDAVPIVLATQDVDEIVCIIKAISPVFGGINLEDISAPRCFETEERLKRELQIPVMHDDQHGTAIIILAGLINALKVVGKRMSEVQIVISGAGAAGTAITKILLKEGASHILVCDSKGILVSSRKNLSLEKRKLAILTNKKKIAGNLAKAMRGADVFIGVSGPEIVSETMARAMAKNAVVFALANPVPEIMPALAKKAGAKVVATGRSDFPNQLNNSQVFPGVFRGALDNNIRHITDKMKQKAAHAIAGLVPHPTANSIVPGMFDPRLVKAVSKEMHD